MRYIAILIFFLLFSCRGTHHDTQLLHEASAIADSIPADALTKLQSIKESKRFTPSDNARYNLLLTQTMLNTGNKPPSDSLINHAIDYYRHTNDSTRLFDALYLKGRYFYSLSKHDSALIYFRKAEETVTAGSEPEMRIRTQRISGFSNLYLGNTQAAIKNQQTALELTPKNDTTSILYTLMNVAQAYGYDKNRDSAVLSYQAALELAKKTNNIKAQSAIFNQLSYLYSEQKDFRTALEYKKQEHQLRINRKEIPARNLAQAMLFDKQNMPDSARYYLELAIQGRDNVVADIAYGFLSDWYQRQGLYEKAHSAWQNKQETTRHLESGISSASLQHQYESERLRNENNELKIKQKEKDIVLMAVLISVLVIAAIIYAFWMQAKRKRDRERFINQERQLHNENLLLKKEKEISALREKEALLRESIFRRISFSGKIPSLLSDETEKEHKRRTPYMKIEMTEEDWQNLVSSVDEAYSGFTQRLKEQFPKLSADDIRFCCLLKINVNMQDLSDIYCVTKAAITKRKYRIKTDKMNLQENPSDLDTFLNEFY